MGVRLYPLECTVLDCGSSHFCKGFCRKHFERWLRHGDPNKVLKALSPRGATIAWLRDRAGNQGDECLIWPFARFPDGRAHMHAGKPSRIMCELAHGPAPSRRHEAAHSCGKGFAGCVNPKHLRWATAKENSADKALHGTVMRGEAHYAAKLTETDVVKIRALALVLPQRELCEQFGVGSSCINRIIKGLSWRHVQ